MNESTQMAVIVMLAALAVFIQIAVLAAVFD